MIKPPVAQQEFLRDAMTKLNMTSDEFANRIGTSRRHIDNWLLTSGSEGFSEMDEMAWKFIREITKWGNCAVTTYNICNTLTGADLGNYEGATPEEALDAMARQTGYDNYAEACEVAPTYEGEIAVTVVSWLCNFPEQAVKGIFHVQSDWSMHVPLSLRLMHGRDCLCQDRVVIIRSGIDMQRAKLQASHALIINAKESLVKIHFSHKYNFLAL